MLWPRQHNYVLCGHGGGDLGTKGEVSTEPFSSHPVYFVHIQIQSKGQKQLDLNQSDSQDSNPSYIQLHIQGFAQST